MSAQRLLRTLPCTGNRAPTKGRGKRDLEGDQQTEEQADVLVPCRYTCLCCVCAQKRWPEGREGNEVNERGYYAPCFPEVGNSRCCAVAGALHLLSHRYPSSSRQD